MVPYVTNVNKNKAAVSRKVNNNFVQEKNVIDYAGLLKKIQKANHRDLLKSSVGDLDPDVFGPPGSGSPSQDTDPDLSLFS
jgi:hypothetical protein